MGDDLNFFDVLGVLVSLGLAVILTPLGLLLCLTGIGIPVGLILAGIGAWCGWRGIQIMRGKA